MRTASLGRYFALKGKDDALSVALARHSKVSCGYLCDALLIRQLYIMLKDIRFNQPLHHCNEVRQLV